MAAMVVQETEVSSTMHAEAAAAWAAAVFARHWSEEHVQLEMDALMVVAATENAGTALHGHFGHLFANTRQILQGFKQWKISFKSRETNRVAHRLARLSLTLDHPISWFEDPLMLFLIYYWRIVLIVKFVWDTIFSFDQVESPDKIFIKAHC